MRKPQQFEKSTLFSFSVCDETKRKGESAIYWDNRDRGHSGKGKKGIERSK